METMVVNTVEEETCKENFYPPETESVNRETGSDKENDGPLVSILKELREQTALQYVNGNVSREILVTQGEILDSIKTHQNMIETTWKDACADLLVKTKGLRRYVDGCTVVQEFEMTHKLASMVENGEVVVISYKLTENGKPEGDIDGLVVGVLDGIEVVIFLEAKSHIRTSSEARRAMKQLRDNKGFWEDLVNGYPGLFSASHGSKELYDHYVALRVDRYGGRPVRFAFGAFLFGPSAMNYFTYQDPKPLCITGNWKMKHEALPLPLAI